MRVIAAWIVVLVIGSIRQIGAAPCEYASAGFCACECPDGSYVVSYSGAVYGSKKVVLTVLAGGPSSSNVVASTTGTGKSNTAASGSMKGIAGTAVFSLKMEGKNAACGPDTHASSETVSQMDECPWCDVPGMLDCN